MGSFEFYFSQKSAEQIQTMFYSIYHHKKFRFDDQNKKFRIKMLSDSMGSIVIDLSHRPAKQIQTNET